MWCFAIAMRHTGATAVNFSSEKAKRSSYLQGEKYGKQMAKLHSKKTTSNRPQVKWCFFVL